MVKPTESLRKAMKDARLTQAEIARRTGRSVSEISLIVNGKREASLRVAKAIAHELQMKVDDLFC
jgi:transcriptional regulator with XRE-family HTH domain